MRDPRKYGEWAVVTGASSGIGRQFAIGLAKQGMKVILVARSADALTRTASQDIQTETKVISADLATPKGRDLLLHEIAGLDVGLFVHSAGNAYVGPYLDAPDDIDEQLIAIHVSATAHLTRVISQRLEARGGGGIILISSVFGMFPMPFSSVYGAVKAFILNLGEALAVELRDKNIDVLSVAPGGTKTRMGDQLGDVIDLKKMSMPMGDPAVVAQEGLAALGQRDTIVPARMNRVMTRMAQLMPRKMVKKQFGKMLEAALIPQPQSET